MEISLCKSCNGTGEIEHNIGGHQSEYVTYTCSKCKGTGRLYYRIYSYEVPYSSDTSLIYKIDTKIIELIRELEQNCKK